MTYSDVKKTMSLIISALPTAGEYTVEVMGILPDEELFNFNFEIEGASTKEILMDTIDATIEELLDLRYDTTSEPYDEDDLLFDGGVHK